MANRWAVLIGINGYHESLGPLNFCANDAKLMRETLVSECCAFPSDNVVLLTDDQPKDRQPTFGNIHSWLGTWLSRPGPDDLVLVYFAGHGRESKDQALLAPLDATLDSLPVTGIPIQYVRDMLDRCKASQKVLILDACHSGAGRDVATMGTDFRGALNAGKGLYTIASCDADQISYEWPEKQHGVFTHYLVEALRHGAPVEPDGRVLLDRVYDWARNGILAWTAGKRLKQEPVRICRTKGDIHIASRSLSIEQRLEVAKAQIHTHQQTIDRLREDIQRLSEENAAVRQELEKKFTTQHAASGTHNIRFLHGVRSASRTIAVKIMMAVTGLLLLGGVIPAAMLIGTNIEFLGLLIPAGVGVLVCAIVSVRLLRAPRKRKDAFFDMIARTLVEDFESIRISIMPQTDDDKKAIWLEAEQFVADELRRRGFILEPQKPGIPQLQVTAYRRSRYGEWDDICLRLKHTDKSGKTYEASMR